MPDLKKIHEIDPASLELLEGAGIREVSQLLKYDSKGLAVELEKVNDTLKLDKRVPGQSVIKKWLKQAEAFTKSVSEDEYRQDSEPEVSKTRVSTPVNYEENPEVLKLLAKAPAAIPIPGRKLKEKNLQVADVPAGLLLNSYPGDLKIKDGLGSEISGIVPRREAENSVRLKMRDPDETDEKPRFKAKKTTDSDLERPRRVSNREKDDRVAIIRAPLESTNRGKSPSSRRFVRGVLHTHPWSLRIGAVITLLMIVILPMGILSAFLLLGSREFPLTFSWVPAWLLIFPIALPVVGFCYLIWGRTGKCRICNQRLFAHKAALKHIKAHRFPGMGYVIPLSCHLLVFNWFRCSSCGTPVRIKK